MAKNEENVQQLLATTMDAFVTDGLKPAIEQKRTYDREAMDYDGLISKHKNLKKTGKATPAKEKESEQLLEHTREDYLVTEKSTMELLKQCAVKGEMLTIIKVVEYWEAMHSYFKEGVKFLDTMQPKVERYRRHIRDLSRAAAASAVASPRSDRRTFKIPLQKLCEREQRRVPQLVVACCAYLKEHGLETTGIFRVSPTKDSLDDLKAEIDQGRSFDFSDINNPHIISGLLKAFLRETPDPIFTFERYPKFMEASKLETTEQQVAAIDALLKSLPEWNYKTLQHVTLLCRQIEARKEDNKMTISNLATVLTPNMLYTSSMDPINMVQEMEQANRIYSIIVEHYDTLFPTSDLELDIVVLAPTPAADLEDESPNDDVSRNFNFAGTPPSFRLSMSDSTSSLPTNSSHSERPPTPPRSPKLRPRVESTPAPRLTSSGSLSALSHSAEIDSDGSVDAETTKKAKRSKGSTSSLKISNSSRESAEAPGSPKDSETEGDGTPRRPKTPRSARSKRTLKADAVTSSGSVDGSGVSAVEALRRTVSHRQTITEGSSKSDDEGSSAVKSSSSGDLRRKKKKVSVSVSGGAPGENATSTDDVDSSLGDTPRSPPVSPKAPATAAAALALGDETAPVVEAANKDVESNPDAAASATGSTTESTETSTSAASDAIAVPSDPHPESKNLETVPEAPSDAEKPEEKPVEVETTKDDGNAQQESPDAQPEAIATVPEPASVPSDASATQSTDAAVKDDAVAAESTSEAVSDVHVSSATSVATDPEIVTPAPDPEIAEPQESVPEIVPQTQNEPAPIPAALPDALIPEPDVEDSASIPGPPETLSSDGSTSTDDYDNLDGLVDDDIPLTLPDPSEYATILLDSSIQTFIDALISMGRSASDHAFDPSASGEVDPEEAQMAAVSQLSQATRELAAQAKALSGETALFVGNYPEAEDTISTCMGSVQTMLRNVIMAVKEVSSAPAEDDSRVTLRNELGIYARNLSTFLDAMSASSSQQLLLAVQGAVKRVSGQIAPTVRALLSTGLDEPFASVKESMIKEVTQIMALASLIEVQLRMSLGSSETLHQALQAVPDAVATFWSTAAATNDSADASEMSQALVQDAKALIAALREVETTLGDCTGDDSVPSTDELRTALTLALDDIATRFEYGTTSDISTRILLASAKRSTKTYVLKMRRAVQHLSSASNSGASSADHFETSNVVQEVVDTASRLLSYIKYHRIDSPSNQQEALLEANTSAVMICLSRLKVVSCFNDEGPDSGSELEKPAALLSLLLRLSTSMHNAIFE